MPSRRLEYQVEVDTSGAVRDLQRLGQAGDRAGRDLADSFDDVSSAGDKARAAIMDMAETTDRQLRDSVQAAEALGKALGPELTARMDVNEVVADLNKLGVSFDEIRAEADQFAATLKQVDGIRLSQVNDGLDTTKSSMGGVADNTDQLSDSARGANSALANMLGNTAQDLGALGGIAGSAGVAIGQMAEYAADAKLGGEGLGASLASMAKVAGPIAAIGGAMAVISGHMNRIREINAWRKEQVEAFAEAIDEVGVGTDAIVKRLQEMGDIRIEDMPDLSEIMIGGEELAFTTASLGDMGLTIDTLTRAIEGDQAAVDAYGAAFQALGLDADSLGLAMDWLTTQQDAYATGVREATGDAKFYTTSVTAMSRALQGSRAAAGQLEQDWQTLIDLQANGSIRTQEAADAWNRLRDATGATDAELADLFRERYDEHLQAQADAAAEAAETMRQYRDVLSSPEWNAAAFEGATTAVTNWFDRILAPGAGAAASAEAFDEVAGAIDAAGTNLIDLNTSEGRATFSALEELGSAIVPEIAQAFDDADGDLDVFKRNMDDVGQRTITGLIASFVELGFSEEEARDQANNLMQRLGLIPENVETIYNLAGTEEAKLKIQLLQFAIDLLPKHVQAEIAYAISMGDYMGAVAIATAGVQQYAADHGASIPVDADTQAAYDDINRFLAWVRGVRAVVNAALSVSGQSASAPAAPTDPESMALAATRTATTPTATATSSGGGGGGLFMLPAPNRTVNVTVQAAVVGNRFDVQRAVTRALRNADRLGIGA